MKINLKNGASYVCLAMSNLRVDATAMKTDEKYQPDVELITDYILPPAKLIRRKLALNY